MDPANELKARVERYLKKSGMTPTAFGVIATGNPSLVRRIREGKIGLKTIRRVTEHLDKQRAA